MVDRRKKMHRELMEAAVKQFKSSLGSPIPHLSQIERMGIERKPVFIFSPRSPASKSYENLWSKIQETIFKTTII
jgi:cellulose biosynthesis protein BcsQ